jgi:hypothetical protein
MFAMELRCVRRAKRLGALLRNASTGAPMEFGSMRRRSAVARRFASMSGVLLTRPWRELAVVDAAAEAAVGGPGVPRLPDDDTLLRDEPAVDTMDRRGGDACDMTSRLGLAHH